MINLPEAEDIIPVIKSLFPGLEVSKRGKFSVVVRIPNNEKYAVDVWLDHENVEWMVANRINQRTNSIDLLIKDLSEYMKAHWEAQLLIDADRISESLKMLLDSCHV